MSQFRNQLLPFLEDAKPVYLEYLEGTGTQWIDTGYLLTSVDFTITVTCDAYIVNNKENPICGNFNTVKGFAIGNNAGSKNRFLNYANSAGWTSNGNYSFPNHEVLKFVSSSNGVKGYRNDTQLYSNNTTIIHPSQPTNINLMHYASASAQTGFTGKFYSAQIYENGVMVRNFRPCLSGENGEPCLYDTVTKQYFYNQGTGKFKYEKTFLELDYVEGDGNQFFITDTKWASTVRYAECEIMQTRATSTTKQGTHIFGSTNNNKYDLNPYIGPTTIVMQTYIYGSPYVPFNFSSNEIHHISWDLKSTNYIDLNFDGFTSSQYVTTVPTSNVYIKILHNNISTYEPFKGRLYWILFKDNYILTMDCIPVYKFDGSICLYNFVTGTYYLNAGTGYFKGQFTDRGKVYEILPYIQASNNAYIDTGKKFNGNMFLTYSSTCVSKNTACIVGASNGSDWTGGSIGVLWYTVFPDLVFPKSDHTTGNLNSTVGGVNAVIGNTYKSTIGNGVHVVNGTSYELTDYYKDYNGQQNLSLFAMKTTGGIMWPDTSKLHYYKLEYVDGGVQQELVPVRTKQGEIGMYDNVSKEVLLNANSTGVFKTEGYLPSGYTQLDYVESSGYQFITVPYLDPTVDFTFEADIILTNRENYSPIWAGNYTNGMWLGGYSTNNFVVRTWGQSNYITVSNLTENQRTKVKLTNTNKTYTLRFNNTQVGQAVISEFVSHPASPSVLLTDSSGGSNIIKAKVYSLKYYSDTLNVHLVPCKNGSNVAGLYDVCSNTFYSSSTGTQFIAGSPI